MPEGLIYWDIGRMPRPQISTRLYRLELHAQFIGKGKLVDREHMELCLQEDFKFDLQPNKMLETWGKALGLSINGGKFNYLIKGIKTDSIKGFWLHIGFALHGHAVAMHRKEYNEIQNFWTTTTTSLRDIITIPLAVVSFEKRIVFLNKNKLILITWIPLYLRLSSSALDLSMIQPKHPVQSWILKTLKST